MADQPVEPVTLNFSLTAAEVSNLDELLWIALEGLDLGELEQYIARRRAMDAALISEAEKCVDLIG